MNAVTRMENGNTFISPRNFNFMIELDTQGEVIRHIGEGIFHGQHDPEILANGNIVATSAPNRIVEIDPTKDEVVWQISLEGRDADRLPNGNTLITGMDTISEVTPEGEVVWQLVQNAPLEAGRERGLGFYKAERINP
jgi:hypothetical protein